MLVTSIFTFLFYIFFKAVKRELIAERKSMDTTVCLAEGPKEKCSTISPNVVVQWDSNTVYCGFRTGYKITLKGVTSETLVKLFFRTDEGELLDEIELQMNSVIYVNKVLIPFNIAAGRNIYIEIQLPEYGVVSKSDCKPVYNSIPVPKRVPSPKTRSFLDVKGWANQLLNVYLKYTQHRQPTISTGPLYPPLSQIRGTETHFAEQQI